MNTDLRKAAKNDLKRDFFKLMCNSVFGKTMKNVRENGETKLVTREKEESIWYPNQIIIQQSFSQRN